MDNRLIRLRVELFTAAQVLQGDDARAFWQLIHEIDLLRPSRRDESLVQGPSVGLSDEEITEIVDDEEPNNGR